MNRGSPLRDGRRRLVSLRLIELSQRQPVHRRSYTRWHSGSNPGRHWTNAPRLDCARLARCCQLSVRTGGNSSRPRASRHRRRSTPSPGLPTATPPRAARATLPQRQTPAAVAKFPWGSRLVGAFPLGNRRNPYLVPFPTPSHSQPGLMGSRRVHFQVVRAGPLKRISPLSVGARNKGLGAADTRLPRRVAGTRLSEHATRVLERRARWMCTPRSRPPRGRTDLRSEPR